MQILVIENQQDLNFYTTIVFMKMDCLFFILYLLLIGSCSGERAQDSNNNSVNDKTDIVFNVKGLENQFARFLGFYGESYYYVDTVDFNAQGTARFQRDSAIQEGLYFLVFPDGQSFVQLLVADDLEFTINTDVADPLGNMTVDGSTNCQALLESIRFENEIQDKLNGLERQLSGLDPSDARHGQITAQREKVIQERVAGVEALIDQYEGHFFSVFKRSGQNPEAKDFYLPDGSLDAQRQLRVYLSEYWDNVDFSDGRLIWTPVFHNKLKRYITEMLPQNGDTLNHYANLLTDKTLKTPDLFKYTVTFIANTYRDGNIMDWEKVYSNIIMKYVTHDRAYWVDSIEIDRLRRQTIPMRSSALGNVAPDITCNDIDGNPIRLNDLKDPIIIVFIYNPTCDHCIEETPELIEFYNQWHQQGIEIYAISFNAERSEYEEYMNTFRPPWKYNLFDQNNDSGFAFRYQVDHTPEIYVINEDRKIIGKNLKVAQIPTILERNRLNQNN